MVNSHVKAVGWVICEGGVRASSRYMWKLALQLSQCRRKMMSNITGMNKGTSINIQDNNIRILII